VKQLNILIELIYPRS